MGQVRLVWKKTMTKPIHWLQSGLQNRLNHYWILKCIHTWLEGAEGCGRGAVERPRLPGDAAALAPDAADPGARAHTPLLVGERLAVGRPVDQHVVQEHAGEAAKHIHGPAQRKHEVFSTC